MKKKKTVISLVEFQFDLSTLSQQRSSFPFQLWLSLAVCLLPGVTYDRGRANKPEGRLERPSDTRQPCMFTFITNTLSSNTNNAPMSICLFLLFLFVWTRVAASQKMATKFFVRRILAILATNASFLRICKIANLIQYNMQYALFLTQKSSFFAQSLP